jgi:hypothetical protein
VVVVLGDGREIIKIGQVEARDPTSLVTFGSGEGGKSRGRTSRKKGASTSRKAEEW